MSKKIKILKARPLIKPSRKLSSAEIDASIPDESLLLNSAFSCISGNRGKYSDTCYLIKDYVIRLHEIIAEKYRESDDPVHTGVIHESNLDYALEKVQEMYNSEKKKEEKLIKKAGFILYNIASKHPFVDGNKRTAIIATSAFLEFNCFTISDLKFRESLAFILKIARGEYGDRAEEECQKFIREHIERVVISKELLGILQALKKSIDAMQKEEES